jgi:hypothetical protein
MWERIGLYTRNWEAEADRFFACGGIMLFYNLLVVNNLQDTQYHTGCNNEYVFHHMVIPISCQNRSTSRPSLKKPSRC